MSWILKHKNGYIASGCIEMECDTSNFRNAEIYDTKSEAERRKAKYIRMISRYMHELCESLEVREV